MTRTGIQVEAPTTVVENGPASQRRDGGPIRVLGFDPGEQRSPVRHLVIFPARPDRPNGWTR